MKTKTLLIDDDPLTSLLNKKIFEQERPEESVFDFCSASLALIFLKENQNSENRYIIFLDLNMPEVNGWEFMEILEKDFPCLDYHVHILTSSIDQNDRRKARKYKAVHTYIEKPLNRSKLRELESRPLIRCTDQPGKTV